MKNLTLIPLLAGLILAPACGGDDDDTNGPDASTGPDAFVPTIDAPTGAQATITVNWPLVTGVDSAPGGACPAGATTARIDFDNQGGQDISDLFDCSAETGTVQIPAGTYIVWVTLFNQDKTTTYAMSFEYDLIVAAGDTATVDAPINVDSGFFDLTWTFTPAGSTCADVPADGVSILATIAGDTIAVDTILPCSDGGGRTDGIPLADAGYVVQISLLDGDVIAGQSQPRTVEPFRFAGELVDIGNFEFALGG